MKRILLLLLIIIFFFSCQKEKINPYDNPNLYPPELDTTIYFSDPTNFASIYNDIFLPTCANAGCHDGSFEPDFRTIESSYNTLVYHPVIKNNPNGSYQYRVKAGSPSESVLYARLLADANGTSTFDANSQVMPLTADIVYDPNQEHIWHLEKEEHISNIKTWIENGAPDMFENEAILPNNKPEMQGVVAFVSGSNNALPRDGSRGTVLVPPGTNSLEIWFSVVDDNLSPTDLSYNKVKFSDNLFDFSSKPELSLTVINTPLMEIGYYVSQTVEYYHKITYDISSLVSGDEIFFKIYIKDDVNEVTEIPNNGSSYQFIRHFTFEIL
tara:strand:- start:14 stop:991 length:978 start_codon:yes stop_codon:yes gene_type:complete